MNRSKSSIVGCPLLWSDYLTIEAGISMSRYRRNAKPPTGYYNKTMTERYRRKPLPTLSAARAAPVNTA